MNEPGERPLATGGFIQFGDGPPIPVTNISWESPPKMPLDQFLRCYGDEPEAEPVRLPLLSSFEGSEPLPTETAVRLLRSVGLPTEADRFEIAAHPDLAELNVQLNGFYGGPETPKETRHGRM